MHSMLRGHPGYIIIISFFFKLELLNRCTAKSWEHSKKPQPLTDSQTIEHPLTLIEVQANLKDIVCNFSHLTCFLPLWLYI